MIVRRSLWFVLFGLGVLAGAVLPASLAAQVPAKPDTVRRDTIRARLDTIRARLDTIRPRLDTIRLRRDTTMRPRGGRDTINVKLPPTVADTLSLPDSSKRRRGLVPLPEQPPKPDTIKAPLAHAEAPPILAIGQPYVYNRTALFATGARTLSELLARVPGVTLLAAGGIGAPTVMASQGNLRLIRLFLDGLELDPQDLRDRGVAPVNDLPLNSLEEVSIERGVEEIRVYARTWRIEQTMPYTRADIGTGDQNTNLYRAFFGRRYDHGEALQLSAEQYTTQPDNALPSTEALNVMARLGMTHGPWSVDGFYQHSHRNRAPWRGTGDDDEKLNIVAGTETDRNTSYLRIGNGNPDLGRWMQLMVAAQGYLGKPRSTTAVGASADTVTNIDSTSYESQYLLTGGLRRGPFRVSALERIRVGGNRTSHVLSGRASAIGGPLSVSLFGEGKSYMNPSRLEATAKLSLLDRIALIGSASRTDSGTFDRLFVEHRSAAVFTDSGTFNLSGLGPFVTPDTSEVKRYQMAAQTSLRAEMGIRVRDLWIAGGYLRRGGGTFLAPAVFDTLYHLTPAVRLEGDANGIIGSISGRLWKSVFADVWGLKWSNDSGFYRPQYQTRSELYVQTNLLDKFPNGNFGILSSLTHEYRSSTRFPVNADSIAVAPGYRVLSFKLEIRVATATVSYQFRNLLQEKYAMVPGFNMPRQTQFYGIRWDFWN